MEGNGKVFISHCHEDNALCQPLLQTLSEWNVDYWFDTEQILAGTYFLQLIEQELQTRDIFIRVCSEAAKKSYWVGLETGAFHCLLAADFAHGLIEKRRLINFIVDPEYVMEPFVAANLYVDARKPEAEWRDMLRQSLQGPEPPPPPPPPPAGIQVFVDDDEGYRTWVQSHASGFVLNTYRTPQPDYVMLHKTSCGWIQRPIGRGDNLTYAFIKICSPDRSALEGWSRQQVGMEAHPCGLCKP